jgi:phosphoglycolate phosphatase
MKLQPRLIVYDLDGTLVDAFRDIWMNINTVFSQYGLDPLSFEKVRNAVGDGVRMLVRRCLGTENLHLFDEIVPVYLDYYEKHPGDHMQLYPDTIDALRTIRDLGITQAVLTNKPIGPTRTTCDRMKLTRQVDGIWGEVQGKPRKPDPESLHKILRHFEVQSTDAVMVGDGINDLKTARAAGTHFIGVTWGQMTRQHFESENVDTLIGRMRELPDIIHPPESITSP